MTSRNGGLLSKASNIAAVLGLLILPLVSAHYIFYSTLGLSPSDVGLDFGDIVQRSTPGLVAMFALVAATLIALYSIVLALNLAAMPFLSHTSRRMAIFSTIAVLAFTLMASVVNSRISAAVGWLFPAGVALLLAAGLKQLFPVGWSGFLRGALIGAPLYPTFTALILFLLPVLNELAADQPPTLWEAAVGLAISIPMLVLGYVFLCLPAALAMAQNPVYQGQLYDFLRRLLKLVSLKRAALAFGIVSIAGALAGICLLAYVNARNIKEGWDVDIFDVAPLDSMIQHSYGLPVTCVGLYSEDESRELPDRALLLGTDKGSDHVLLWDGGVHRLPSETVSLTHLDSRRC